MKKIKKTDRKNLLKWAFVLIIIGLIIYVFRDMAGPIAKQLMKTSPWIIVLIILATLLYGVGESTVTMLFARQYNPSFYIQTGVWHDLFCFILPDCYAWKRRRRICIGLSESSWC